MSEPPDNSPAGKPPKEPALMRSVLKHVHAANQSRDPGRHQTGLGAQEPIHLTSFHDHVVGRGFQRLLASEGIPSSFRHVRGMLYLDVDMEDRSRASNLLRDYLAEHPDIANPHRNRRFDFAILGAVIGLTTGVVLSLATFHSVLDIVRVGLIMFVCALMGHLLDRFTMNIQRGLLVFGVYEFLILAVIPAFVVAIVEISQALVLK